MKIGQIFIYGAEVALLCRSQWQNRLFGLLDPCQVDVAHLPGDVKVVKPIVAVVFLVVPVRPRVSQQLIIMLIRNWHCVVGDLCYPNSHLFKWSFTKRQKYSCLSPNCILFLKQIKFNLLKLADDLYSM
jgi:hypothetical protein